MGTKTTYPRKVAIWAGRARGGTEGAMGGCNHSERLGGRVTGHGHKDDISMKGKDESLAGELGSKGWWSGGGENDPETIPFQISHRDLLALLLPKMRMVMRDVKGMETLALVACKPTRFR